jgi:lysyl-tRNA synthetase class 1
MTNYAINYYNDFVKSKKDYLIANEKHKIFLKQILDMLTNLSDETTGEEIQNEIYKIGRKAGYKNLRNFFKEIYQILLGQTQGPRLGSFFKLYGITDTIKLIENKVS